MTEEDDPIQKKKEMFGDEEATVSKGGNWMRRLLVWLLVIAAAILLLWFFVFVPQAERITQLSSLVSEYEGQLATQEAQITDLQANAPLRDVYSLLADANSARFELSRSRYESASAALLSSQETLTQLGEELSTDYASTLGDLQARLDLAKDDITGKRSSAALSDLDIYVDILAQLARSLAN